jgi:uncharacterized protein
MYRRFGVTLMLTHACNLRCTYCYTGAKYDRSMPFAMGRGAIDRAVASLSPGGSLELGFFGGEPLLEAALIKALVAHTRRRTRALGMDLSLAVTTNGTVTGPEAWSVMMMPELELSISCDGLPDVHDRHRLTADGRGTAERVLATIRRLVVASRDFRVVTVVRPDTMDSLPDSIAFLQGHGVRGVCPCLDVWARWSTADISRLERIVARCARLWRLGLPHLNVTWFDEKAGLLAGVDGPATPRCGFGDGEIAVAPSGRLYPCERLIGDDTGDNRMALPGHVLDGVDFLDVPRSPRRSHPACDACTMRSECSTTCRCGNYIRTGDVSRPDGLLCAFNQACLSETARSLNGPIPTSSLPGSVGEHHDKR